MDFNDDVESPPTRRWVASLGLVEAITWLHPQGVPPTFQQGSQPIDGIFVAPQLLDMATGRYLSFGNAVPIDHRAIWLDLSLPAICPKNQEANIRPMARQLQCKDPRIVAQYKCALIEILEKQQLPQRLQHLNTTLQSPTNLQQ